MELRRSGWSKAIPEIITFNPVVKNAFSLDSTGVEKNNTKMFAYGHYLKLEKVHYITFAMWYYDFVELF